MTTMTLKELSEQVKIKAVQGARLDWDKQDEWQRRANGWRVTLSYQGRSIEPERA